MAEQRMVPVELLESLLDDVGEPIYNADNYAKLRAIIDGPGMEPVAEVKDELDLLEVLFKGYGPSRAASEGLRAIRNLRTLYLASHCSALCGGVPAC